MIWLLRAVAFALLMGHALNFARLAFRDPPRAVPEATHRVVGIMLAGAHAAAALCVLA